MKKLLTVSILLFSFSVFAGVVPDFNGIALKGVKEVNAFVFIAVWSGMDKIGDKAEIQSQLNDKFQLALRRDGVVVARGAPNYLACQLSYILIDETISYSFEVGYWENTTEESVDRLLWRSSLLGMGGEQNFSTDYFSKLCTDTFSAEWLKQNPQ